MPSELPLFEGPDPEECRGDTIGGRVEVEVLSRGLAIGETWLGSVFRGKRDSKRAVCRWTCSMGGKVDGVADPRPVGVIDPIEGSATRSLPLVPPSLSLPEVTPAS